MYIHSYSYAYENKIRRMSSYIDKYCNKCMLEGICIIIMNMFICIHACTHVEIEECEGEPSLPIDTIINSTTTMDGLEFCYEDGTVTDVLDEFNSG